MHYCALPSFQGFFGFQTNFVMSCPNLLDSILFQQIKPSKKRPGDEEGGAIDEEPKAKKAKKDKEVWIRLHFGWFARYRVFYFLNY